MENQGFKSLFMNMGFDVNEKHEREFYIDKNIDVKGFERILIKADVDYYLDFLMLVFYKLSSRRHNKTIQKIQEETTNYYILKDFPKEEKKARVLKLIMENPHDSINIEISSPKETVKIKDEEIIDAISSFLCEWFRHWEDEHISTTDFPILPTIQSTDIPFQPNIQMLNAVISGYDISKYKINKGAPEKLSLVKDIAIKLLLLFRWDEEVKRLSIEDRNIYIENIKPKNKECKLIHDILVFWNLIESKNNSANTNTPINYIRTMIANSKKK